MSPRMLHQRESILEAALIAGERKPFTPLGPRGDEAEEEFNNDLSRPREVLHNWQMEASSGRRLLDPLGQGIRKGIAALADKVSRHYCSRFSADCIKKVVSLKGTELCIKDSPRLGPLRRWFSKMSANEGSSSHSSSRTHW